MSTRHTKGILAGLTDALDASEDGPAKEGIQNHPSVSSPSSATLDNALQDTKQLCHKAFMKSHQLLPKKQTGMHVDNVITRLC